MVLFTSKHPEVQVPEDVTVWQWLFESEEFLSQERNTAKSFGAFIDAHTRERLDFVEVKAKSTALSNCWVQEYDLKPGDTVTVFSGNTIWYPVCTLAVFRAGARINGASAAYTVDEMAYALKVAKSKIVVAVPSAFDRVRKAAEQVGIPSRNVLLINGHKEDVKSIQDLILQGISLPFEPPYQLPSGMTNKQLCGNLNFSSGTTGLPKPVMISHHNVIAQCYLSRQIQSDVGDMTAFAILPLYHIIGTWRFCLFPIFLNVDIVMLPSFTLRGMLQAIVDFRIEEMMLVPPIVLKLARDPIVDEYDLRHVKRWISGAAPISSEVLKALEERFPWTGFRSGYGATEAPVITTSPESHYSYKYATSVGMLIPNTVAKVVDPSGKELGPGETGEILVRGPQVAMSYMDNEEATMQAFDSEGFYHSGDAGYFDQDGLLYISDRIKEMIKVKGTQVAPAELEDLLHGHKLVADCAVIGTPDEYAGEVPKAYIVLANSYLPSREAAQDIFAYVQEKKARFKWLAEVEFVDAVPKSPSGKLLRQKLRAADRSGAATSVDGTLSSFRVNDVQVLAGQV